MARINNIEDYTKVSEITGDEILLGSLISSTGRTVNFPITILSEYFKIVNGDSNLKYNNDFDI